MLQYVVAVIEHAHTHTHAQEISDKVAAPATTTPAASEAAAGAAGALITHLKHVVESAKLPQARSSAREDDEGMIQELKKGVEWLYHCLQTHTHVTWPLALLYLQDTKQVWTQ